MYICKNSNIMRIALIDVSINNLHLRGMANTGFKLEYQLTFSPRDNWSQRNNKFWSADSYTHKKNNKQKTAKLIEGKKITHDIIVMKSSNRFNQTNYHTMNALLFYKLTAGVKSFAL